MCSENKFSFDLVIMNREKQPSVIEDKNEQLKSRIVGFGFPSSQKNSEL